MLAMTDGENKLVSRRMHFLFCTYSFLFMNSITYYHAPFLFRTCSHNSFGKVLDLLIELVCTYMNLCFVVHK